MASFRYRALERDGRVRRGVIDADSPRHARSRLREQGLLPAEVVAVAAFSRQRRQRLPSSALVLLTRQLSSLIAAGLPLEQALTAVAEQTDRAAVRAVLHGLRNGIVEGHGLARSLEAWPGVFSPLYRALIDAGERSGNLDLVLGRLSDYLEHRARANGKVIQALAYPCAVLLVAIVVVTALMSYVVPQVVGVFVQTRQTLPFLTRSLMSLSAWLREWGAVLPVVAAAAWCGLWRLWRAPAWRRRIEAQLLRLPVVGSLLSALNAARMASTLAILVGGGVPLLTALATVRPLLSFALLRDSLQEAGERVREGMPLSRALGAGGLFPPLLVHLVASGEASGTLPAMLERAAAEQQQEVDRRLATFSTLLEPAMILFMGGLVLLIVLAIMQPIIDMNQMVR
jgi:general secretion pathway protein F